LLQITVKAGGGVDLSVLIQPVHTSTRLTGMRQALHALEAGSPEVKRVLIDEVNLVYECRVCLAMFRSLANLLAHKRHYCRHRQADVRHEFSGEKRRDTDGNGILIGDALNKTPATTTVMIEPEPVAECCLPDPGSWGGDLATYSPSMELIKTAGILQELSGNQQTAPDRRKTLNAVLPRLTGHRPPPPSATAANNLTVRLEPVYSTANALYQSWHVTDAATGQLVPSVGEINMALQRIVIADQHTVVGPDGVALDRTTVVKKLNSSSSSSASVVTMTSGQAKAVNGGTMESKGSGGVQQQQQAELRKVVET
jgi:hypothetical protein